jgi:hypothetical protein
VTRFESVDEHSNARVDEWYGPEHMLFKFRADDSKFSPPSHLFSRRRMGTRFIQGDQTCVAAVGFRSAMAKFANWTDLTVRLCQDFHAAIAIKAGPIFQQRNNDQYLKCGISRPSFASGKKTLHLVICFEYL